MHPLIRAGAFVLLGSFGSAYAQGADVASTLAAHRIAVHSDGKEAREPATSARPGDVIEYAADYRNKGAAAASKLEVTIPIPVGTDYVADSSRPAAGFASTDGVRFEAMPLKHRVSRADGTLVEQLVPVEQYRALRWAPQELGAGANATYSVRTRMVSNGALVAAAK